MKGPATNVDQERPITHRLPGKDSEVQRPVLKREKVTEEGTEPNEDEKKSWEDGKYLGLIRRPTWG